MITKDQIEGHKVQLIAERDQALARLNAYIGAIAECEYWLKQLEEEQEGA